MKLTRFALPLSVIAAMILLAAGPGARFGAWEFGTGFLFMRIAFYAGLAAAAFGFLLLVVPKTRRGNLASLTAAVLIGLGTAWVPWNGLQTARSVPPIHDITTDMDTPPAFVDIAPLRAGAPNPVTYEGEAIAAQQREAYPDLKTLELAQSSDVTFRRALAAAEQMGWEIIASSADDGRIEATDTTLWFGFKDDVVIRIEETASGSRLDIRSKSRVGRSDVGANAERIRSFVAEFEKAG